ncbi:dTDP-4-dehydrorhamnose reductase [Planococcus halocryophilus Or1]|nr:dTDP-4-dehydrorhamnose reductase [Planococcus halocryophilus Or1]
MIGIDREDLNLTINKDVESFIRKLNPDAIIHCAAYTAVDKSEEDREGCWDVNVNGTEYLATVAKEIDAKFIYISTDYVYDGEGQEPFVESDRPNPQGYYGLTKYEGEKK